ncbi:unnamed protein product [Lactuca saligna]|uniref:Uncharacterized protein n=1 Tax=Lactuca saligna TaxID=75948 RepID=A0AA35VHZ6_LACSI|nr:unnamed protein product [Lactuca saligna]
MVALAYCCMPRVARCLGRKRFSVEMGRLVFGLTRGVGFCFCEITDMSLTLSTVIDIVLLEITISCGVCMEALCVIMAAEDVGPLAVGPYNSFVGAVVIVKLPCCDV